MKKTFLLILQLSIVQAQLFSQSGFLDSSFGDKGKVLLTNKECYAVAIQDDNKIIGVGVSTNGYLIVRHNPDGSLDEGFAKNGILEIPQSGVANGNLSGVCIDKSGKIIVTGNNLMQKIFLARIKPGGTLDSSFGINGSIYVENIDDTLQYPSDIILQNDGKIIVAGKAVYDISQNLSSALVARFMPDGSYDETFGNKGRTIILQGETIAANSVALQQDGKIVIGGYADIGNNKFLTARLNTDGSLDDSFGNNGEVITPINNNKDYVYSVVVQNDGKIISGGSALYSTNLQSLNMNIVRYLPNGDIDKSFANNGISEIHFGKTPSYLYSLLLQNNGKIIAVGATRTSLNSTNLNFALARLNKNGVIDSSFGTDGLQSSNFTKSQEALTSAFQKNGDIILAGYYFDGSVTGYALSRYLGDPTHPVASRIKRWIKNHILNFTDQNPNTAYYAIEQQTAGGSYKQIATIDASKKEKVESENEYSFALPAETLIQNSNL